MRLLNFRVVPWLFLFLISCHSGPQSKRVQFTSDSTRFSWSVSSFELPEDWDGYDYLVLDLKVSSPQRYNLGLYTGHGYTEISIYPFQGARITFPVPLHFFRKPFTEGSEMANLYSHSLETGWFNIWDVRTGPLDKVDSIVLRLERPLDDPVVEIYGISLSKEKVPGKVIKPKVLVDKFGQWIPERCPGDVYNIEQLRECWSADDSLVEQQKSLLQRDPYGGFPEKVAKATGFFYTKKIKGRWWFVDPFGHLFLATGMNGVSPGSYTRTKNRNYIFEEMPPEEFMRRRDGEAPLVSYSLWNQYRHYGKEWRQKWKEKAVERMQAWGFNAINWSVPDLNDTMVYAKFLYGLGIEEGIMGFPDVYSGDFEEKVDKVAREQCAPIRKDPRVLGYFLGNEPVFPGRESLVVDAFLAGPETKTKEKLIKFLSEGDTPERRKQFVYDAYRHFLKVVVRAIKKYDTNHLILGMRFGNLNISDEMIQTAKIFDVFSFNRYTYTLPKEKLDHVFALLDMPILVGEFHFGVPGRGLYPGLVKVPDQEARGKAYRNYVEHAFAHPAVVATFWFLWRDQPVTGRGDGENYNIGMVDVKDLIYRDLVKDVMQTHQRVYDIHQGVLQPYSWQMSFR